MNAPPPHARRILLLSLLAIPAILIPVAGAWVAGGVVAAQALYIGVVVTSTAVRTLPEPRQWAGAGWLAAASAAGVLIGDRLPPLLLAVALCCVAQLPFIRSDARAMAVTPAILVLWAGSPPSAGTPVAAALVAVATFVGGALMIAVAHLARLPSQGRALPLPAAIRHGALLAVGCCAVVLLTRLLGFERTGWGLIAFCLVFLPASDTLRTAFRNAAATAWGAVSAVTIAVAAPGAVQLTAALLGALLTVWSSLGERSALSVAAIAATVTLLGSFAPEAQPAALGLERAGTALLAVAVALALTAADHGVESLLTRRHRARATRATP